jgi:hypothetical protein
LKTIVVADWTKKDQNQEKEGEELKKDEYRVYAIFCEIVLLVVMTHCIHAAYVLMDDPMPEFPLQPAFTTKVYPLQWKSMIQSSSKITWDASVTFAPFFTPSDIQRKSSEFQRLSKLEQEALFDIGLEKMLFGIGLGLAPVDLGYFMELQYQMYLKSKVSRSRTKSWMGGCSLVMI